MTLHPASSAGSRPAARRDLTDCKLGQRRCICQVDFTLARQADQRAIRIGHCFLRQFVAGFGAQVTKGQ